MKVLACLLFVSALLFGCGEVSDPKERSIKNENKPENNVEHGKSDPKSEVSFKINLNELYGDWVLIGVSTDRTGLGQAPDGELFFAFRKSGNMTVATEGRQELEENLVEIPAPYEVNDKKLCSTDLIFQVQFHQECAEIIRLNEGRMSIEIEVPGAGYFYKHFLKLDD